MTNRETRLRAGIPLIKAAEMAGVSYMTLRFYEVDESSVKTPEKRASCQRFYDRLRQFLSELS